MITIPSWETIVAIYITGFGYSAILFAIACTLFTLWRWGKQVSTYIEDGYIDDDDRSWFYGEHNWVRKNASRFGNHPGVVLADFCFLLLSSFALTIIWPISVIVTTVIVYAKIRRAAVVRKKTFVAKLDGTHVENNL